MTRFGKTQVDLSGTVTKLIQDINEISDDLGNINNVTTDSNVVQAIQRIDSNFNDFLADSDRLGIIVNAQFNRADNNQSFQGTTSIANADIDSAEVDDLLVRNNTSLLGSLAANAITSSSVVASGNVNLGSITMDGISSLAHVKELKILDSGGNNILAGYIVSTSNTAGTL